MAVLLSSSKVGFPAPANSTLSSAPLRTRLRRELGWTEAEGETSVWDMMKEVERRFGWERCLKLIAPFTPPPPVTVDEMIELTMEAIGGYFHLDEPPDTKAHRALDKRVTGLYQYAEKERLWAPTTVTPLIREIEVACRIKSRLDFDGAKWGHLFNTVLSRIFGERQMNSPSPLLPVRGGKMLNLLTGEVRDRTMKDLVSFESPSGWLADGKDGKETPTWERLTYIFPTSDGHREMEIIQMVIGQAVVTRNECGKMVLLIGVAPRAKAFFAQMLREALGPLVSVESAKKASPKTVPSECRIRFVSGFASAYSFYDDLFRVTGTEEINALPYLLLADLHDLPSPKLGKSYYKSTLIVPCSEVYIGSGDGASDPSAIPQWIAEGVRSYMKERESWTSDHLPSGISPQQLKYLEDGDPIRAFVDEKMVVVSWTNTPVDKVYQVFKVWCQSRTLPVVKSDRFVALLESIPLRVEPIGGEPHVMRLMLKP